MLAKRRGYRSFFGSPRGKPGMPELSGITDVAWFVGPEGGFTPEEENHLRGCGAADLRLGPWVLRVETAAVGGCMILQLA